MIPNFTVIVNTCEKFSDIWGVQCSLLNENWADRAARTILLSDDRHAFSYEGIELICAGRNANIVDRLQYIIDTIDTEYIFITLDDYLLVRKANNEIIARLISAMDDNNGLDYIRLYPYPKSRKTTLLDKELRLFQLSFDKRYDVNLYPGLWRTSFLKKTLHKQGLDAWSYEVSLTKTAMECDAKCAWCRLDPFPILDSIRKGKFLHKAKRFIKKRKDYCGDRGTIAYTEELRLFIMKMINTFLPDSFRVFLKGKLKKRGVRFYSDD